uniref:Uncharacterized protein n=1 Tax=viral metagenome TaxID=1070528 RepID=A0A6M3LIB7_9ZZZZ
MLTDQEQKVLLAKLENQRKEKVNPLITNVLLDMFQKDLPINDADYMDRRAREVVEQMMQKIDFKDKTIIEAKKKLLSEIRKKWKQFLPPRREWRQKKLDLTEQRGARCEPVVYALLEDILKDDLILSDSEYFEEAVTEQSRALFYAMLFGYVAETTDGVIKSVDFSKDKANKILWGGKEKEGITTKQLDAVLKSEKKLAEPKK